MSVRRVGGKSVIFGIGHKVALTDSGRDRHMRAAALAIRRHVQREREVDSCGGVSAFAQKSISSAASNADNFEKLQMVPLLIPTPLTFLGGTFYSTSVLPPFWRTVTLFNPLVYLISGFRWSFSISPMSMSD